ncbi:Delta8-fatty-acid desaturase [Fistulifera solaris]|jgi:fatty acid desaturase/predicted heme/steroid binding protein|uniref:Delta6 desaturase-b n=1 Tax=Fistulifera solaris TaxID=1519565 RepID=W0S9X3_FISSO|nr:delta6 desaturase-b [Fistulifera solaris]GAX27437.1 Delta8-fatty-acid desaturase [Fistulifera solaris]|eukprot:GAX27437.1 Delta8-fatty-acid desaturase [Fistulifera solaris]
MGKGGDASAANKANKISWSQVKEHCTPDDAWVVYQNKVYDVSNWHEHPGGAVIFTHAGDDMTDIFAAFHAPGSQNLMQKFYIGDLIPGSNQNKTEHQIAFEKGYRDLRSKLILMGMFKSNGWFYVYKCVSNMMLWATAVAMVYYSESVAVHMASAVLLGLFFQQCGWLAHDFLHHQVFRQRKYGDLGGIYWGNLMQGYSVQWWKNKHNGHHAVPNLHNSTALSQDGDPDIDTMPLLAWSLKQAQSYRELQADGKDSASVKFLIRYQAYFYFPILLLARLSWLNESFKTAFGLGAASENAALELKAKGLQYPILEKVGILLHYAWMFVVSSGFGRFPVWYAATYFLVATASCGFLLAIVFGLGHNGMATYDADARPDFWKLQVTTTRNITGGHGFPQAFVDWFCGGLQYQVDHHLFPSLPRHNLAKTHALVRSFCKEWNVHYHEADLVDGTIEVLQHLSKVSNDFLLDFVKDGPTM